ncbi:hypothetical protein JVT61DRAFT_3837 [Boletus reticuloceps]|uniref:Uncharacterized protein n=1 Tax=Boletus reticuloceps TaxID=495285 RepID=A0A8I2YN00_9AGAM|nr:hypothetical protein JVT61DRAFT_3837 [Boletus reticuloceps]
MLSKALSISQTETPLLSSSFGHVTHDEDLNKPQAASPSQAATDLPSWTPLGNDEGSVVSDSEVDELATRKVAESAMKQPAGPPTNTVLQATVESTVTAGRALRLPSNEKPSKRKKARFDGVVIATKPPSYRKLSSQTQRVSALAPSAWTFNLVDALSRTFDANRHAEVPLPRQSHTASRSRQRDDVSTETTEAEDEQLQLNTRLAHTTLKRQRRGQARIIASETNSEDAASLPQDIPQPERPAKRIKPIQYEANPTLIDAALGTEQAPISWDAELDFITRDEDLVAQAQTVHVASAADVQMAADENDPTASSALVPSSAQPPVLGNEYRMPTWGDPKGTVFSPYQSRGAKFRQRLEAIFGENTTVRMDRVARPRPVDLDFIATLDEVDREPSPIVSESTASVSSPSTAEEVTSAIPSTRITSQSPDVPPPTDTTMDDLPREQLNAADFSTRSTSSEEQMNGWIAALQRLVKGKVHVKEEHLEMLSIILAEIESMKGSLDDPMVSIYP